MRRAVIRLRFMRLMIVLAWEGMLRGDTAFLSSSPYTQPRRVLRQLSRQLIRRLSERLTPSTAYR